MLLICLEKKQLKKVRRDRNEYAKFNGTSKENAR